MLVPIPDLANARRVLCVQPHYDDNDIGAGGTVASLIEAGAEVTYLTVTDDRLGVRDSVPESEVASLLRREQAMAAKEIGVQHQIWLDFPDGGEYDYFELRRALVREIRRVRPDFVLTCDPWAPYEAHSDHVQVGRATAEAILFQRFARFRTDPEVDAAHIPYGLDGIAFYFSATPNTVCDIDVGRARKHRALDAYVSQFSDLERQLLHGALEIREREWAKGQVFTFGEAFKVLSPAHLHVSPDAEEVSRTPRASPIFCRPVPAS